MKVLLTKKNEEIIVCEKDYQLLKHMKWCLNNHGYPRTWKYKKGKSLQILLHSLIMGKTNSRLVIDHINGNKLDNRRCNLRFANKGQNAINSPRKQGKTSKYKGVTFCKKRKKYYATYFTNNKTFYIGTYLTEIDAAKARDKKVYEIYGEFAYLNFPIDKV